ncbi:MULTISPECIES: RNA polymerase sigma factor [Bacillaceae]|jgi:RNA polymerase sigma factor (sigma-70 family)|uniref:RNA polymerase sigma-70 factor (ECF subfamily) n=1 Tax=Saccharococcus thermophilus TaxID=29396 RepID=A0A846ML16_9BACL|nr:MULTISPECIES: RNA polymerase sigma factor [Bacillaceae]NIK16321.1 RNA polymerase sigma-70 factor (ECF subfamily) [Saccharococcus thermophilus]GLH63780.1 RNA polymerase sigma factor [Parageobacillus sp. G301]
MHDEQHLLAQCRQGNKDAFYLLVSPHLTKAYRLAFTILRSHHDAEDAIQNSLLEAYRAISEDKEIHHFSSWFYRLVTHRAIDLARKLGKERQYTEISDMLPFLSNSHHLPVDEVISKEEEQELLAHILKLDMKYRVILVLYYYQNMKISEIAELLQIKEGTVKSRLFQARNLLYQAYQEERKEELR